MFANGRTPGSRPVRRSKLSSIVQHVLRIAKVKRGTRDMLTEPGVVGRMPGTGLVALRLAKRAGQRHLIRETT